VMFVPFLLAGAAIGLVLMDRPGRIGGHYAANLAGSGIGAVTAVALMSVLSARGLLIAAAVVGYAGALVLTPWRRIIPAAAGAAGAAALVAIVQLTAGEAAISQYKMLSYVRQMPGTRTIHRSDGPLGRIDVVANRAVHYAPGLSMRWTAEIPDHALMILDGDQTSPIYDCRRREDWAFTDYTTSAAAYHVRRWTSALIIGAGGGADIGAALYHADDLPGRRIVALEMNAQVIEAMNGPLADIGGRVYRAEGVKVVNREARGYLASRRPRFDVVQLPPTDALGASGAGLYAAQESFLYTLEAISALLETLTDGGVLCATRWARTPPRDGLRLFDMAGQALRRAGLAPAQMLAMIRSWSTVTVLVRREPFTPDQQERLREFCTRRGFDLCYLPDLVASEANRYHVLERPYYFEAARALLGDRRREFLDGYLFDVTAATDDRPYFFSFFRWRTYPELRRQLKGRQAAFVEIGNLMLIAALVQAVVLAGALILLPLTPKIATIRSARRKGVTLGYFCLLGGAFMLLEMGLLQRLILYLAHPIYSAATVIAAVLIFAGLGSRLAGYWRAPPRRIIAVSAGAVVVISLTQLVLLEGWLDLTRADALWLRFIIAVATIAPLAVAMGHMFPTALGQLGTAAPSLVPWAWAVNGFASVVATVAAPLLAMNFGFARLIAVGAACYAWAGLVARYLPGASAAPRQIR